MKQLRRWAMGLIVAMVTLAGIVGFQASVPAQPQAELTLETAGLTLEEVADGVYGLLASTDFPPADAAVTAYPRPRRCCGYPAVSAGSSTGPQSPLRYLARPIGDRSVG